MSGDAGAAAVAERRVLSVQSHVIHRYVGNTRAPGPAPEKGGGRPPPFRVPWQTTNVCPKVECFDSGKLVVFFLWFFSSAKKLWLIGL